MHQRATRSAETEFTTSDGLDEHNLYYYDAAWRLLEERVYDDSMDDDALTSADVLRAIRQRIWGLTYIDELAELLHDEYDTVTPASPDGDMAGGLGWEKAYEPICDRRYDVVELLGTEQVRYTPYGVAQVRLREDINGSGTVDGGDLGLMLGNWGKNYGDPSYDPDIDINRDGKTDGGV